MSEQNGSGPAGQPANAAPQPGANGTGTYSGGQPQIDPGEYQRLQRIEQQWKGAQPFVEKARGLGFKSAEDFDKWAPVVQKVKDPAAFSRAWEGEPEERQPASLHEFEELLNKREAAKAAADAEKGHMSAWEEEQALLADEKIAELFKDSPKEWQQIAKRAMLGAYHSSRQPYEDGHPLAGKYFKPVGKDGLAKIQSETKAVYDALEKHFQGKHLAAVGDAGRKTTPSGTSAGASPQSGSPPSTKEGTWRPEDTRAEAEAYVQARRASRGDTG